MLPIDLLSLLYIPTKGEEDIIGLYTSIYDANKNIETLSTTTVFDESFRKDAKGDASIKQAFNNYFIRYIIPKKNGGFLLCAESEYITTRNGIDNWNRWDAIGMGNNGMWNSPGFYGWNSPFGMAWNRNGAGFNQSRYFSDNIVVASIDSLGNIEWNNVIPKSQFDDNTDAYLGFGVFNAGNQLRILFNELVRQQLILNRTSNKPKWTDQQEYYFKKFR
jgi:hypothetical protein